MGRRTRGYIYTGYAFAAAMLILCLSGDYWLYKLMTDERTLPVKAVKVDGALTHLKARDLADLTGRMCAGQNLAALDTRPLRERLLALPWLAQVMVSKHMPGTLVLSVVEHVPAAYWNQHGLYDARTRTVFYPTGQFSHLPLVRLEAGRDSLAPEVYEQAVALIGLLRGSPLQMAALRLDEVRCFHLTLTSGTVLILGRERSKAEQRLRRFLRAVPAAGIRVNEFKYFDLRYEQGFAAGPRIADK